MLHKDYKDIIRVLRRHKVKFLVVGGYALAALKNIPADFFTREGKGLHIGVEPMRVDIITHIEGVSFAKAYPYRQVVTLEGLKIPFIGLQDLIRNKEAAGRDQDKVDANRLKRIKRR